MIKISIDQKECIGCGYCENICPEVFEVSQDKGEFKAKVKSNSSLEENAELELVGDILQKVKEAEDGCAVRAIKVD